MKGIYKIVCLGNNKIYISKSIDIESRFKKHLKDFDLESEEASKLLDEFLEIFKSQPQAKSKCNRLRKV